MEKTNRINWHKGMDISPEVFIDADNYHIYHQNVLSGIQALKTYGIIYERPENKLNFHIESRIENAKLTITDFYCHGITQQGFIVDINRDARCNHEINLSDCDHTPYYLLISVNPYKPKQISDNENDDYAQSSYIFKLQKTSIREHNDDGIPVLKVVHTGTRWEIVDNYIPPCIALSCIKQLEETHNDVCSKLLNINQLLKINPYSFQMALLELELKNYSGFESPFDLFLLLKKFVLAFTHCSETELRDAKKYLEMPYNHNEIAEMFKIGVRCLDDIIKILTSAPKPEPVEIFEIKI